MAALFIVVIFFAFVNLSCQKLILIYNSLRIWQTWFFSVAALRSRGFCIVFNLLPSISNSVRFIDFINFGVFFLSYLFGNLVMHYLFMYISCSHWIINIWIYVCIRVCVFVYNSFHVKQFSKLSNNLLMKYTNVYMHVCMGGKLEYIRTLFNISNWIRKISSIGSWQFSSSFILGLTDCCPFSKFWISQSIKFKKV